MSEPILSIGAARALHLAAQGMLQPRARATKDDVLAAIRRMGVLQIDTISVVARSPYLVLWSRLGDYDPAWLDDCWPRAGCSNTGPTKPASSRSRTTACTATACSIPGARLEVFRRLDARARRAKWRACSNASAPTAHPRSSDFERRDGQGGGWWVEAGKALARGAVHGRRLMIARRHNFQRVYDLAERVLPGWDDARMPPWTTVGAVRAAAVKALGLAKAAWIPDYHRTRPPHPAAQAGRARACCCAPASRAGRSRYSSTPTMPAAGTGRGGKPGPTLTSVLSPFDPIVWDRRRALELFGFDYRLECYTPAEKRRYGYFTLPLLRRGALVGRVDAKAHRAAGVFELKSVALEPGARN
jgi:uncharacterized protein YcaQ